MTASQTLHSAEPLLTAEQAAERLNVSRNKVFELIASGELMSLKIGGSRRITPAAVAEYIARMEQAARP